MEVNVDISFGLESQVTELIDTVKLGVVKLKELAMKITNVNSCVWCGVAFLRGHGGTFQPLREMRRYQKYLLVNRNVERFESSPSHQSYKKEVAEQNNKPLKFVTATRKAWPSLGLAPLAF